MAYEHEGYIKNLVSNEAIFSHETEQKQARILETKEVYQKAETWEELKKHIDEEVDSYMTLYRETKDPVYSLLNSHYDALLGYIEELEGE